MGDRANVYVHHGDQPGVYLYTHWAGSELPDMVHAALTRKQRWNDEPYLTRIIFCTMVQGCESEETGFGISASIGDGRDRIIDVDTETQQVTVFGGAPQSFQSFIRSAGEES
jgi:hypothetical protein